MRPWPTTLLLASALLAVAASAAAADHFELKNTTWRGTWRRMDIAGGFGTVECALTLEGSFHERTFAPTSGLLIGYVTRATVGACPRGSATVLTASLPWHVRYSSFSGTLPTITAISLNISGAQVQVREPTFGITCLASAATLTTTATTGEPDEEGTFPISSLSLSGRSPTSCGVEATVSGTGTVTVAGETAAVQVRAIPFPGVLGIESLVRPQPRIRRGVTENFILKNTAVANSEKVSITQIRSEEEATFRIGNPGNCVRQLASFAATRQTCTISVTPLVEEEATNVRIFYRDLRTAQTGVLRVESE
jgi:hypothetical protein